MTGFIGEARAWTGSDDRDYRRLEPVLTLARASTFCRQCIERGDVDGAYRLAVLAAHLARRAELPRTAKCLGCGDWLPVESLTPAGECPDCRWARMDRLEGREPVRAEDE